MKVFGLFSGIGGFEASLENHDMSCVGLCEIDDVARAVLSDRFPGVSIHRDIKELKSIPRVNVLTAGFPCQDLSQAGPKRGIRGERSSLVDHVFRLLETSLHTPEWVILENVSYMLKLQRGDAMQYILSRVEELGFNWAYRVLDARSFGVPQRRERVIMLLSKKHDPSQALFPEGHIASPVDDSVGPVDPAALYGFYWTEGKRGLGWTKNAVPTIKGGSGLGIPSPPAIWDPRSGAFGTPSLTDAERLFGFTEEWTSAASTASRRAGARWQLLGNTVCVPMVDWVVQQIANPAGLNSEAYQIDNSARPPRAAFGLKGMRYAVECSTWPTNIGPPNLREYLAEDLKPLSLRAASGFYSRALSSTTLRFADGFLESLAGYIEQLKQSAAA